jgi:predicted MPP superfamily phosphohydrolase
LFFVDRIFTHSHWGLFESRKKGNDMLLRLVLFLLVFSGVYAVFHAYAYLKVRGALSLSTGASVFVILFMLVMVFLPVIVRVLERLGLAAVPRTLAYVAYIWMGLLLIFVWVSLVMDVARLLLHFGGILFQTDFSGFFATTRNAFYAALLLSFLITGYGLFEAVHIRTERVTIKTAKIPESMGRLKIVQISDVHLGLIVRQGRLRRITEAVNAEKPDILVSTGDLVDGEIDDLAGLDAVLRDVHAPYGKFAVTGNHEFYAGIDRSVEFTEKAGFQMLRGEAQVVPGLINIAGVDDPTGNRFSSARSVSEKEVLSSLSREGFTLLLKHRPLVAEDALGLFDLQLSGHAHKGQIFPATLLVEAIYPTAAGFLRLEKGSCLYVSRGAGTWGPPIRFLASPEVTVIELVHEGDS